MKKLFSIIMALALLLTVCAAAESELAEDWNFPDTEDAADGWEGDEAVGAWTYTNIETAKGGQALREMFDKAMEGMTGVTYTPAALLATQTVAGNNYCILCHAEYTDGAADTGWSLVYIYEAFGGDVQVTNIVDIDVAALSDYGLLH